MKSKGAGSVEFKAGQIIITEGDPGQEMYIVEEGEVEIFRRRGAEQRNLGSLEPGDFFGEMGILDDLPRGASVRARTDCKLLVIDSSTFDQMLRKYPEVAVRMLRKLARRLRQATADPGDTPMAIEVKAPSLPAPPAAATASKSSADGLTGRCRLTAAASGAEFLLSPDKEEITIGRYDSVTGVQPDIDLTSLDTQKVCSRRHAKIVREGQVRFLVEGVGTANGTFLRGERIGTGVKMELSDGDEIKFGDVKMIFRAD